jgi:anaerobic selenocysteine-containing dehydrogenase
LPNPFSRAPIHDPIASPAPDAVNEVKTTTCYMCACRCGIRVHLRDGELRYIDGNPNHPINHGVICAKGASGIMKQVSPARLTRPLLRKAGSERGAGEFEPISWERAFAILEERLRRIRATDPKKFALFTGRDQMQALTSLFARNFGTPNYAAHGGFCSVNMAAGMIYTIGGSFWEFGGPDLERAKLFVMLGTAEDHHSNPLKIEISKFKRRGGRFVSINPVRTGYSAIADEWIPIRPGTDGALLMALLHALIASDRIDHAFLQRFTNAPQLVLLETGCDREGMFAHDPRSGEGARRATAAIRTTSSSSTSATAPSSRRIPKASPTGCDPGARRSLHARRRPPRRAVRSSSARAGRACTPSGPRRSPASPRRASSPSRTSSATPRSSRRSSCRFPGPTRGARSIRRREAGRSRSTRCAASPRIRTASRRCARSRC